MRRILSRGIQTIELLGSDEAPRSGEVMRLKDRSEAMVFLRSFSRDPLNVTVLRRTLGEEIGHQQVNRLRDSQVIEHLAARVSHGRIRVAVLSSSRAVVKPRPVRDWTSRTDTVAKEQTSGPGTAPTEPTTNHWIKWVVVDDTTGRPIPGVSLAIVLPGGSETLRQSDAHGEVEIRDIASGACRVSSPVAGVTREQTLAFVALGERDAIDTTPVEEAGSTGMRGENLCIAEITEHKVKTGESLASIAKTNNMPWQALAEFNWGTSDPDEINAHLRDDVGCTVKTLDGYNYLLRSEDEPGLLFIPRPWLRTDMATRQTHTIRVAAPNTFVITLENEEGLRIPFAEFKATLADGRERTGRLGPGGVAVIENPLRRKVKVVFTDPDDVRAKSLAAVARQGFGKRDIAAPFELLQQSPTMVQLSVAAYDAHFNDHGGNGFIEDLDLELREEGPRLIASGLLLKAGLTPIEAVELATEDEAEAAATEEYAYG